MLSIVIYRNFIHPLMLVPNDFSLTVSHRYWDWSLDWSDFHGAPVWDITSGLGRDGSGSGSVGNGKCVTSGPFSDIEVMFYDGEVQPHCLSRGFPTEKELKEFGQLIRPDAIKHLKEEDNFKSFASELEKRAHTFLTHSVRGNLSRFTGPNGRNPLEHTQTCFGVSRTNKISQIQCSSCIMRISTGSGRSDRRWSLEIDLPLTVEGSTTPKQRHI